MTTEQAVWLHEYASGEPGNNYSPSEKTEIWKEIEAIVKARSERSAANIIRWWGCWDRKYPAIAFVRKVRDAYKTKIYKESMRIIPVIEAAIAVVEWQTKDKNGGSVAKDLMELGDLIKKLETALANAGLYIPKSQRHDEHQ